MFAGILVIKNKTINDELFINLRNPGFTSNSFCKNYHIFIHFFHLTLKSFFFKLVFRLRQTIVTKVTSLWRKVSILATLKDVAAMAGVHPSTVSRVLRGKENIPITETTRQRIKKAAKDLKYLPDERARALRLGKSHTIGLVVPDISNVFFAEIAKSIEIESYEAGYTLVVCDTNEEQEKEVHFVNSLISRGVDGLIIAPVQDSADHIFELKEKNYPFVLIDRCFEEMETNAVISDNEDAAFKAVAHLAGLGHKRVGFLSGRQNIYTIRKRLAGYKKAVEEYNLEKDEALICGNGFTFESGYEATFGILSLANPPTALLISGNIITLGAIKAILEKGLSIPDDISMIGFTDNIISPYLVCPLTSISHPLREMGKKAFDLLIKHVESKDHLPITEEIIKTQFYVRKSTSRILPQVEAAL